jgi:hypothetical protein
VLGVEAEPAQRRRLGGGDPVALGGVQMSSREVGRAIEVAGQ